MKTAQPNDPVYPAYRATDQECFAYDSTIRRWPIILDSAINEVNGEIQNRQDRESKEEGALIVDKIQSIKEEILSDKPIRHLQDSEPDAERWNTHVTRHFDGVTWFNGTWLFNECYMYRRLAECFNQSKHWRKFDPFEKQKMDTFRGSHGAVFALARELPNLLRSKNDQETELAFQTLVSICLWGNATDLSLLTNMSEQDIKKLQAVEADHLQKQKEFILVDDSESLWKQVKDMQNARVDVVLDNSGFELFVDLILADWMLHTGKASQVVFHCKTIPWFVSDVQVKDVDLTLDACLDHVFFADRGTYAKEDYDALETLVTRWKGYIEDGRLDIRDHHFWCSGLSYWHLKEEAPELFNDLRASSLVIFKGDLNFRKLVYDCAWPVTTPFKTAIGPELGQSFTNVLSLRTNKADPIVGLSKEMEQSIQAKAKPMEWRCSGKYAVIELSTTEPTQ